MRLLWALSLLGVSFLRAAAAEASPAEPSRCLPKKCGGLNITYPFWLEDPSGARCGSPSFQLKCNNSRAFLRRSVLESYRVVSIFVENSSFHVVDDNLPLATGCPAPPFNISLGIGLGPFLISSTNYELLFLSKCKEPPTAVPPGFRRLPCDNLSFVSDGVERKYGSYLGQAGIPSSCLLSAVPTLGPSNGNRDDYISRMKNGFLLKWTGQSTDCPSCMASGGECMYGNNGLGFACKCSDGIHDAKCDGKRKESIKIILIASLSAASSLILISIAWIMCQRKKMQNLFIQKYTCNESNIEEILKGHDSLTLKRYGYSELRKITRSFKEKLGEGGYGMVFKGNLEDGHPVAVKILKVSKGHGEEFLNEVVSIRRTSHVNVVNLLGFCLHGSKRALIYEYMDNGSLDKYIYSEESKMAIGWDKLKPIAIGIARGLEYLHQGCNTRIIHFDIKPHNVLLDEDFCPKIADFGLAKLCHLKDSALSIAEARGTIGFIAPEVFSRGFGIVSTKSDVYSYGMMLLEMVEGRTNVKENTENSSEAYFPNCIYSRLGQSHKFTCETEEIERQIALVGLWCIQTSPVYRPSMSKVIEMLESNISELTIPPKPFLSCPSQPQCFSSHS